jgi:hypothetical protein
VRTVPNPTSGSLEDERSGSHSRIKPLLLPGHRAEGVFLMKEKMKMIKEEEKKDLLISELLSMGIYKQEGRQLFQVPYEELLKLYQENKSYINQ